MIEIKGRVVVYSIQGCPHCKVAKKTLKDQGVNFFDVSVDRFPAVRTWLQEKTGKTSVPQIFFNETYVGGNAELQDILRDEKEWQKLLTDIQENKAKEDELIIPHPSEAVEIEEDVAPTFTCEDDPAAAIFEDLKTSGVPHDQRISFFSTAKDAFSGEDFVKWIMENKNMSEEEAVKTGSELLEKKYIKGVQDNTTSFSNDAKVIYRLTDGRESTALNGGPTQNCLIENASDFSETLRKLIIRLYNDHISTSGKSVNYKAMKGTSDYKEYTKLSRELQRVPVEKLDQDGRKAFFINIYNALVIHSTVENGPPTNWLSRLKFFDKTSYIIGGHSYSLNEIENGVLRANKRGPVQLFAPFGKNDPRRNISLIQVDPRIHFALNCGAKSCPPIKIFSGKNINDELRIATEAYLETDEALKVEEDRGVVHLSSLLRWYSSDFGDTAEDILNWVHRNVAFPEKKEALQRVIESKKWKVQYIPYEWGTNENDV
ncbi:uncharacterized protein LOC134778987 [Penaeus indicus]|uniref:uncharacterized protein LOC134778987 n=1 Tax=Penaeus indicus TaxID=29960 RepID=UPI00300C6DB4